MGRRGFLRERTDGIRLGHLPLEGIHAGRSGLMKTVEADDFAAQVIGEAFLTGQKHLKINDALFEFFDGSHGVLFLRSEGDAKGLQDAVQDPGGLRKGDAVVGDRHAGTSGLIDAPEHEGAVDHAAAAVNDKGVL